MRRKLPFCQDPRFHQDRGPKYRKKNCDKFIIIANMINTKT